MTDLSKAPMEELVRLVEHGLKQLGEMPMSRRSSVEAELNRRAEARAAREEDELAEAKKATKKKPTKPKAKKDASKE